MAMKLGVLFFALILLLVVLHGRFEGDRQSAVPGGQNGPASQAAAGNARVAHIEAERVTDSRYVPVSLEARLNKIIAMKPESDAEPDAKAEWHYTKACTLYLMRKYAEAEACVRSALQETPGKQYLWIGLSIMTGKQGRYAEAERLAVHGLTLNDAVDPNAEITLACWEYKNGKRAEAEQRIERVPEPDDPYIKRHYHTCRASFYAIAGDVKKLQAEMKEAIRHENEEMSSFLYFANDVLFDPYRKNAWFANIIDDVPIRRGIDPAAMPHEGKDSQKPGVPRILRTEEFF